MPVSHFSHWFNTQQKQAATNAEPRLSPERERKAIRQLQQHPSLEETYELASRCEDALTVLRGRVGRCDCHAKQLELI